MTKRSIARRVSKFRMQARYAYSRLTDVSPSVYLNILLGFWVICLAALYFGRPGAEPEIKVGETTTDYNWFGQPGAVKQAPKTEKAAEAKEPKPVTAKATAGGAVAAPSVQVAAATAVRPILVKPPKKGKKKSGFFIPPPPPIGLVAPPPPTVPIPQSVISMGPGAAGAMGLTAPPPPLPQWAMAEPTVPSSYGSGYDPSYSSADVDNASLYARSVSRVITVRHRKKTIALK